MNFIGEIKDEVRQCSGGVVSSRLIGFFTPPSQSGITVVQQTVDCAAAAGLAGKGWGGEGEQGVGYLAGSFSPSLSGFLFALARSRYRFA